MIQILRTAAADLEKVIVVPGHVVAFGHLLHFLDGAQKRSALAVAGQRDGHISGEWVAYRCGIYESGITTDHSALLEFMDAISGRRSGKTEFFP